MKKKVTIIGAGVSGLSVGCYLQMNGFDTEIFESHSIAGGLCTSWQRGPYTINGSAHWIMGSSTGSSFYKLWSELLDLSTIPFVNHELKLDIELKENTDKYGNNIFHVYNDLNRFESYLLDIAPEDSRIIKKFIKCIRVIQQFDMPPIMDKLPFWPSFVRQMKMIRYVKILPIILDWAKETNISFSKKIKNPFLSEGFRLLYDNDEVKLLVFAVPFAALDKKSAGYPIGGAYSFAKRIEDKYISLGGKIHFNSGVKEIVCEDDAAKGLVLMDGRVVKSDNVVSTADWHYTFYSALKGAYADEQSTALLNQTNFKVFFSAIQISFGVARSFDSEPHYIRFPLEVPILSPDGTSYGRLEVHIYNYDNTLAPQGKTIVEVSFYTTKGDFWIDLRKNNPLEYRKAKMDLSDTVLDILEQRYGNIKANLEMTDVATPSTYLRYTNNWKGSTQGWLPGKNILNSTAVGFTVKGLKNFYYAGQWCVAGGGLPVAIKTGRDVSTLICKDNNKEFSVLKS